MSAHRQVAKFVLSEGAKDAGFEKLSLDPKVTITGVVDGLTKEGDAIRVVDYIEKIGKPAYVLPIC